VVEREVVDVWRWSHLTDVLASHTAASRCRRAPLLLLPTMQVKRHNRGRDAASESMAEHTTH
jgi:hypothetical protein